MFAKNTFNSLRKTSCSIAAWLRVLAITVAIALSPLGFSFSTCQCSACDCSELESGSCGIELAPCRCCSSGGCGTSPNDEERKVSCECLPCQCDLGIAVDPTPMPGTVDASKPISNSADYAELISPAKSGCLLIVRCKVPLTFNIHTVYCRWLI